MKIFAILVCSVLCALAETKLAQDIVFVGGGVPRPGRIQYEKGMTIEAALSKSGLELSQCNKEQVAGEQAFPVRVALYRKGTRSIYDPRIDAEALQTTQVLPLDTIELKDYSTIPVMIEIGMKRLSQMIELGTFGISSEMLTITSLQHEYASWRKTGGGKELESLDSYVGKEVARLTAEGKGQKSVDFLKLRLSEMKSGGIGPAHPEVLQISALIELFTAQQQRNQLREGGAAPPATAPESKPECEGNTKPGSEAHRQ
jgi:hypothetical protein